MNSFGNARGALFMVIAMAAFTCNDALVKSVTHAMNTGQILFVRGLMTSILVLVIAKWMGALGSWRVILQPAVALRLSAEILASLAYVSALGAMPLANTSAILQSLPLAVTLGAALFLGEKVGWRRWLAITAGFVGVLIVIRPGPDGFSLAAIYVIASVVGAAARDLATRKIRSDVPSLFISAVTAIAITVVGGAPIGDGDRRADGRLAADAAGRAGPAGRRKRPAAGRLPDDRQRHAVRRDLLHRALPLYEPHLGHRHRLPVLRRTARFLDDGRHRDHRRLRPLHLLPREPP
jgi:hypothetical protein